MIYVNCGGTLDSYNNKKEVLDFFEDCILCSEGSERERYTDIYFSVKENFNTNKRCFTDGTKYIYDTNIKLKDLNLNDLEMINKFFATDVKMLIEKKYGKDCQF